MIPFWLPEIVSVVAAGILVFGTDARRVTKLVVVLVVLLALVLRHGIGTNAAWAAGLALQVAVSVFALIWFKLPR